MRRAAALALVVCASGACAQTARGAGGPGAAIVKPETLSPWLLELPSGRVHGIGPALAVGLWLGDTAGNGTIGVDGAGISWNGAHYDRVELDQREVRVGVDGAT